MDKLKVILDTDIGDDIDDAFALALIYANKNIDLLGVTTVFKNTVARAKQVHEFFKLHGETNISVRAGIEKPLKEPIHYFEKDIKDAEGIIWPSQYDHDYNHHVVSKESAVDFIIKTSKKYSGDLILVPIGPLTNIAQAILTDPTICTRIKKIVLMGGWFNNPTPEWNILCDPEAADIVFKSGIDVYCVGLDVTLQCTLDQALLTTLYQSSHAQSKLLTTWLQRWFSHFNFQKSVMHDPLAVATLMDNRICTFEKMAVVVDLENKRGTILTKGSAKMSNVYVAVDVNKKLFFELFNHYLALDEVKTSQKE